MSSRCSRRAFLTSTAALAAAGGCHAAGPDAKSRPAAAGSGAIRLQDITAQAGIHWSHNPCRTGHKFLPETVGGGGGFIDYDNDGWLDIILINGAPLPGYVGPRPSLALYRNNRDGTFTDVTARSGLDFRGYGMGAAVADFDNDGWPDLYITAVGGNRLYRNHQGRFQDVTEQAGVGLNGFGTAAAWIDYNRDGLLDLFAGTYVYWTPQTDLPCGPPRHQVYCAPYQYRGSPPKLFRNLGGGRFQDSSSQAGILGNPSKTLAVVPFDFNGDGWIDLYLANDTEPDVLLINSGGRFSNQGLQAGIALGADGTPTGSMGADAATPFSDGRAAIAVGTFAGQEMSLFVESQSAGAKMLLFDNLDRTTGLADATRFMTTFGTVFADLDLDGLPEIVALNGHIDMDQSYSVAGRQIAYRQPPLLFRNEGDGRFQDVARQAGISDPFVGRGLAVGDFDNDGRPDLLAFENGGPVRLWRNVSPAAGQWLGVSLTGTRSPRDGSGAMVTVSGAGWQQARCATTTRSFLSVNDPRVHFGLGDRKPELLTVRWSSGAVSSIPNPPVGRYLEVKEAR